MSRQSCPFLQHIQVRENWSVGSLGESRAQVTVPSEESAAHLLSAYCVQQ